jgi:hypothetical protein
MQYFFLILGLLITVLPHPSVIQTGLYTNIQTGGVVTPAIDSPASGQAVEGEIEIRGSNAVDGFQSYEVAFASAGDSTQSWNLILHNAQPIQDGIMAVWDTNAIPNGVYYLRLLIIKADGSQSVVTVGNIHVRNGPDKTNLLSPTIMYVTQEPVEQTSTPASQQKLLPGEHSLPSTPAPLPTNPAEITPQKVMQTFGTGAALSIGVFVLLGVYTGLRAILNGRK